MTAFWISPTFGYCCYNILTTLSSMQLLGLGSLVPQTPSPPPPRHPVTRARLLSPGQQGPSLPVPFYSKPASQSLSPSSERILCQERAKLLIPVRLTDWNRYPGEGVTSSRLPCQLATGPGSPLGPLAPPPHSQGGGSREVPAGGASREVDRGRE